MNSWHYRQILIGLDRALFIYFESGNEFSDEERRLHSYISLLREEVIKLAARSESEESAAGVQSGEALGATLQAELADHNARANLSLRDVGVGMGAERASPAGAFATGR
ncbi:MAG: hypothetical protein V4773_17995 [Verrucomicrobiota bacterium]